MPLAQFLIFDQDAGVVEEEEEEVRMNPAAADLTTLVDLELKSKKMSHQPGHSLVPDRMSREYLELLPGYWVHRYFD